MDREMRETFQTVFDKIDALRESQDQKLDATRASMETKIESLRQEVIIQNQTVTKISEGAKTTRAKIDEHLSDHKDRAKWWLGIIAALMLEGILGVWAWFKMHVNGK